MKASYQLGRFWQVGVETSCCHPRQASQLSALAQEACPRPVRSGPPTRCTAAPAGITPSHGGASGRPEHMACGGPQLAGDLCVVWGGPYIRCLGTLCEYGGAPKAQAALMDSLEKLHGGPAAEQSRGGGEVVLLEGQTAAAPPPPTPAASQFWKEKDTSCPRQRARASSRVCHAQPLWEQHIGGHGHGHSQNVLASDRSPALALSPPRALRAALRGPPCGADGGKARGGSRMSPCGVRIYEKTGGFTGFHIGAPTAARPRPAGRKLTTVWLPGQPQ